MIDNRVDSDLENTVAALLRPPLSASNGPLRFADFYPGLGAASLAAINIGLDTVRVVEPDFMIARAYVLNFKRSLKSRVSETLLDRNITPDVDIVSIHLANNCSDEAELAPAGSRFQEAARFLRVRQPPIVVVNSPNHPPMECVEEELRLLRYHVDRGQISRWSFIVGAFRGIPVDWSSYDSPALDKPPVDQQTALNEGIPRRMVPTTRRNPSR